LPVFHFQVDWGGSQEVGFAEVSGLNIEHQTIEYRDGLTNEYSAIKMPGIPKYGNVTLKRGIIPADNDFYQWLNTTKMHKVERRDIIVKLLNEEGQPVMTWKARNAFPVKIEGPGLKATGNDVAIESIEIAHEGLTIENG
jgi:phage tail-like protein